MTDTQNKARGLSERDTIAARFLMRNADTDFDWAVKYLRENKSAEHYGDCTDAPISCLRCPCDQAYEDADFIIDRLSPTPPAEPSAECCKGLAPISECRCAHPIVPVSESELAEVIKIRLDISSFSDRKRLSEVVARAILARFGSRLVNEQEK